MNGEHLEILSVDLLIIAESLVQEFRGVSHRLDIGLGWHYLLDLPWAAQQLVPEPDMQVIDAGAGTGIMQWWLAEHGVNVISVDRGSRYDLPLLFRQQYRVRGWRRNDLAPLVGWRDFLPSHKPKCWREYPSKLNSSFHKLKIARGTGLKTGTVFIYNQDLAKLSDIPDNSIDAIVSISALEHNRPEELKLVVKELMRVLKPRGRLIATLGAAKDENWFHTPSQGWCYTESTLRDVFQLSVGCSSNYDRYDDLFEALRNCSELRDNLADFYFQSGNNGMPWGVWDPKYQSVGVVKVKQGID